MGGTPTAAGRPPQGNGLKICRKCLTEKPFSEFHSHQNTPDLLENYCKLCRLKTRKGPRRHYPETQRAYRSRPEVKERRREEQRLRKLRKRAGGGRMNAYSARPRITPNGE